MPDDILLRRFRQEDIPYLIDLFRISFNKEVGSDFFQWKYEHAPWSSAGYLAIVDGVVAAFYGGLRLQFRFDGKLLWAYQLCDVMTHPDYRGKLFSKTPLIAMLGELLYKDNEMDFAFGFPSLRHARLQSLRLGGEGYRLIRLFKKENIRARPMLWKLKANEGWSGFRFEDIEEFINYNNKSLRIVKDKKYVRWRYIDNPSKEYGLLTFKRLNITKGYIIFIIEDGWFNVLEVFFKDISDLKKILTSAETYAVKNMSCIKGMKAWFHPNEPVLDILKNSGYEGEDHIPIAFKSVNKECGVDAGVFYERFFYRMGDYDAS